MAHKYLPSEVEKGFDKYKYNSVDTSPVSNYICHPFWNWFVQFFPKWLAPNVMTLAGFLCLIAQFSLLTFYDGHFYAASRDHPDSPPVPIWVWAFCAFTTFAAHTLDGCDGKQARRTKTSSPLGELFDHGLDSWASLIIPVSVFSVFGREENGVSVFRAYLVLIGVMLCFIASHWEKYNTGYLFLPWGYDISQIALAAVYLITYFKTYEFWKFTVSIPLLGSYSSSESFELVMHVSSFGMSIPMSLWNVYKSYYYRTGNMLSLYESLLPLFSTFVLFATLIVWTSVSKCDIISAQPRLFYWMSGAVFSNITCRLIIRQMSSLRTEVFNWLLVPLIAIVVSVAIVDLSQYEPSILLFYAVFATLCHIHFGVCVVHQMADHFNISAFCITKKVD